MRALSSFFLVGLVGLAALAAGCDDESTGQRGCGLITAQEFLSYRPNVIVVDAKGAPVCDARVVAREGDFEAALRVDPFRCHAYAMPSRVGNYEVRVEKAGYAASTTSNVRVADEPFGCAGPPAVPPVSVALRPAAGPCDGAAVSSLEVDVRDAAGAPVCDARVVAREGGFEGALRPVPNGRGGCTWTGPTGRPGTYDVSVGKPGYEPALVRSVVVAPDPTGCHVVPAKVDAKLVRGKEKCKGGPVESFAFELVDENNATVCGAVASVREGYFEATLQSAPDAGGACRWTGLLERPGTYFVEITKEGHEAIVLSEVEVGADACHVFTYQASLPFRRVSAP